MAYVIAEPCIGTKDTACVDVCPVDCIHPRKDEAGFEAEKQLYIHPDECIDCGVCEPECPAEAIKPDTEPSLDSWLRLNAEYAKVWPNITTKREAEPDAKDYDGRPGKLEEFFSPKPGQGD